MRTALAAMAVLAAMAAGCGGGGGESNYSLDVTARCFRDAGYHAVSSPERKGSGRLLGVSTSKAQIGLVFHDSSAEAEKKKSDAEALPVRTGLGTDTHVEQRRNVIVLWLTGPDSFEPKRKDLRVLDRCLT